MATLKARIGSKHVETMVSTGDLGKTQGKVRGRPQLETNWFYCTHHTDATPVVVLIERISRRRVQVFSNAVAPDCPGYRLTGMANILATGFCARVVFLGFLF